MQPTSPTHQQIDLDNLAGYYARHASDLPTADVIEKVTQHHLLPQLIALDWLAPVNIGRWSTGFRPSGRLAEVLAQRGHPVPA